MTALPDAIGAWRKAGPPRAIDARTIFDYMDGGGELYLAYRFVRLDVQEYLAPGEGNLVAELYRLESSDDAFGLLSNDWGGEPVDVGMRPERPGRPIVPAARALYGAGLLRLCSGSLYARVLASRETPAARTAVLDLGRAIVAGGAGSPEPSLVAALDGVVPPGYRLRSDRVCFLRSHLVLNAAYFVSTENVFDLGRTAEAVTTAFEPLATAQGKGRIQVLLARYQDEAAAAGALRRFVSAYLPEAAKAAGERAAAPLPAGRSAETSPASAAKNQAAAGGPVAGAQRIEHGWVAYRLNGSDLAVVFDAVEQRQASDLAARLSRGMAAVKRQP